MYSSEFPPGPESRNSLMSTSCAPSAGGGGVPTVAVAVELLLPLLASLLRVAVFCTNVPLGMPALKWNTNVKREDCSTRNGSVKVQVIVPELPGVGVMHVQPGSCCSDTKVMINAGETDEGNTSVRVIVP